MIQHLRNNSKILLAITGVILMLTWLIFPALSSLFEGQGPAQGDYVKVTWRGGRLTARELEHLRYVHAATVRFVGNVIREAQQRQGNPRAPGYPQISLMQHNFQIGINPNGDDGNLLQTELLAQRGREMGVKVNDETVKNFLRRLSDDTILKDADFAGLMEEAILEGSSVTQGHVFDYLKKELLAQEVRLMLQAGVESFIPGELAMPQRNELDTRPTPAEMWSAYEKLHRRVTIEAYPLPVEEFVGKVSAEPKTSDLRKIFEDGRNRIPHPASDEPGFMQPHRVAFGYVRAELKDFTEIAKKEITDEAVAKAYEEGKAKGEFKVVEPPPMNPADKPDETKPGEDKPGEKPADAPKPDDKPADDKPATDKPANNEPKTDKPTDKPADKPEEKPAEKKADDPADKKAAEPKKNEGSALNRDIQLVNFQEEGTKEDAKQEEGKKTEPPAATKEETKTGDTKPAETKPAETKPTDPAAKPAETTPAENKPADPATKPADPAAKPEKDPADDKPVKFKPLEEVADEIRTNLAQPIAIKRRQELLAEIQTAVNNYSRDYGRWKVQEARDEEAKKSKTAPKSSAKRVEKPAPLDLSKLVAGTPAKVGETPLVDQNELQTMVDEKDKDGTVKKVPKYEIARASFFDTRAFQQRAFSDIAFAEKEPFYAPQTLPFPWEDLKSFGGAASDIWVYWRTDEVAARERTFEEAQKDVLQFWKEQQAFKLAQAAAAELAEKASKGQDLKSLVTKPEAIVTPPAFSWYTSRATGQFGGGPVLSDVVGVEYPGQEFRQAVYDLQVGQAGVAPDQPHSSVWVVKLLAEDGISDADRERFMATALDNDLLLISFISEAPLKDEINEQLMKEYNISWTPVKEGQEE